MEMLGKKSKRKVNRSQPSDQRTAKTNPALWRDRWWLAAAVVALGIGLLITTLAVRNGNKVGTGRAAMKEPTVEQQVAKADAIPAALLSGDASWNPSWPPLPQSGSPARPIEVVRAAYAYAVRREDVLKYIPCYCGCERQGHRSNHDCFVKSKTAAGVPQWDPMGYT